MAAPDTQCQPPQTDFHLAITADRAQENADSGGTIPVLARLPIVLRMSTADFIADRYPRIPGNRCRCPGK
jgi:hypothetical protein